MGWFDWRNALPWGNRGGWVKGRNIQVEQIREHASTLIQKC